MAIESLDLDALFAALSGELAHSRAVDVERAARSAKPMADVKEDSTAVARDERKRARRERDDFRDALEDVAARTGCDAAREAVYSAKEDEDRNAGVLIRYLGSTGAAELGTDEREPRRTLYRLRIDWGKLRSLAAR